MAWRGATGRTRLGIHSMAANYRARNCGEDKACADDKEHLWLGLLVSWCDRAWRVWRVGAFRMPTNAPCGFG